MIRQHVLTTEDSNHWRAALSADECVMGSLEYCRIMERQTGYAARLFVVESADARIVYPFFLRQIPSTNFLLDSNQAFWDTTTPEYTGPMMFGHGQAKELIEAKFKQLFLDFCQEHRIVAEFAHLNPWSLDLGLLDLDCVEVNREIVYVDLTWGKDAIWNRSLSSDTRRQMKQSVKAGVRVRRAESRTDILEFHRLYSSTMKRRGALEKYYFPLEYFLSFFESMANNAFFMLAEYQEQIVAGGLYLQDTNEVYWHLSVMDMEFSQVRPVNAYHYETILWAVNAGKQRLLCGGGYEPGDGVFRFKAGFSPLRAPFKVYKRIHNPEAYAALLRDWSARNGGQDPPCNFFPVYRSTGRKDGPGSYNEQLKIGR